jgi:hypothetical protein
MVRVSILTDLNNIILNSSKVTVVGLLSTFVLNNLILHLINNYYTYLCYLFSHLQNVHFDTDKNTILQNLNMLHFYGKLVTQYYTRLHLAKIGKHESVNPCHWECGLRGCLYGPAYPGFNEV